MGKKKTTSQINVRLPLATSSSSRTLEDIGDELYKRAKETNKTFYFLMVVNKDGKSVCVTADRERVEANVKESESEKRLRFSQGKWEETKQKAYLRKYTIVGFFEGLAEFIKKFRN